MSSWYSNLVSTTSSRISNLRSTLLGGDADGDTPDDTNVCRVLRAYYTEKGRQFPPWLPPDPKAPPPAAPVFAQPTVGSRYGMTAGPGGGGGGGGALSSLWDNPGGGRQDQQSLRQGRGQPPPMRGADMQQGGVRPNPYAAAAAGGYGNDNVQARPLPSQRAGSYQTAYGNSSSTPPGAAGGGSAQDRLRNRLLRGGGGARTTSPGNAGPFQPPPQNSPGSGGYGGGGGGGGNYEDRFAPGGMYDGPSSGGYGGGGGGDKPFMAANAPWATNEMEFAGSGGGGGGGRSGGRPGLPSGPRGAGLPQGPRMR